MEKWICCLLQLRQFTTGKLSWLGKGQTADSRAQGRGLKHSINGREKHRKSENTPNAKLSPLCMTVQGRGEGGRQYRENLLCNWVGKALQPLLPSPLQARQSLWPPQPMHVCSESTNKAVVRACSAPTLPTCSTGCGQWAGAIASW